MTTSPGGYTCTWTYGPNRRRVTGLKNDTAYSFTVTATNRVSTSPASNASKPVTPETVVPPSEVRKLQAKSGPGSVTATWRDPTDKGGVSAVTFRWKAGANRWSKPITTKTVTVQGRPGKKLTISVRAVNSAGPGPVSKVIQKPKSICYRRAQKAANDAGTRPSKRGVDHGD